MNKIVAVIPTTLKRETLLIRSIESVLSQTRPADHIVISCDAHEQEIKTFAALLDEKFSHASIQIVANIRNKGLSENLNNAFDHLATFNSLRTIVSLLDDDDYWMPDYLSHVEKKFHDGATFVAASFKYVGENGDALRPPPEEIKQDQFLVGNPGISNSTMSIMLETLRQIGGWNNRLASCTDRDACLRLLGANAVYGIANDAVACIDRKHGASRLTDKGGRAKFSGLSEFYRLWRSEMSPDVYAASRERSLKLFDYDPGLPEIDSVSGATCKHLIVAVTALDQGLLNRLLLSFDNLAAQKFHITFIVFRNNPSLKWQNHAANSFEVLFFQHPNATSILKIADARNFLQVKVREYLQERDSDAIIWFLDEDFTVDALALEKMGEVASLDPQDVDAIIGKYEGDSPNAAFSGLLFELSDLYENLSWLNAQPATGILPDRAAQNDALQRTHPETYNYALSHNTKPKSDDTAWLEPSYKGETIAKAKERLLKNIPLLKQGISIFRPLRARHSPKGLVLAGPTLHRGGNTIILNHRMLEVPFPEIQYENGSIRRSDMMWAILATRHGGFKILSSNIFAKHQRCETITDELALEKTQDELVGSIVFNSLKLFYETTEQNTFAELLNHRANATATMLIGYFHALHDAMQRLDGLAIAEVSVLTDGLRLTLNRSYV